jgi:heat shock protein HslJ
MKILKLVLAALILLAGLAPLSACQTLNSPIENLNWVMTSRGPLTSLKSPIEGTEITIYFDSQTKEFRGNSGCNQYSGTYQVDGLELIINDNIAVTTTWCSDAINEQERQYLEMLKVAVSFRMDHGKLIIYSGQQVINFSKK